MCRYVDSIGAVLDMCGSLKQIYFFRSLLFSLIEDGLNTQHSSVKFLPQLTKLASEFITNVNPIYIEEVCLVL
jgi:hypothetical protein